MLIMGRLWTLKESGSCKETQRQMNEGVSNWWEEYGYVGRLEMPENAGFEELIQKGTYIVAYFYKYEYQRAPKFVILLRKRMWLQLSSVNLISEQHNQIELQEFVTIQQELPCNLILGQAFLVLITCTHTLTHERK